MTARRFLLALALTGCTRRIPPPQVRVVESVAPARPMVAWSTVAPGFTWTQVELPFDEERLLWTVLRFDLSRWSLQVERSPDDTVTGLARTAAVNAGYFEPDHAPSGLLISRGHVLGRPATRGGSGVLTLRNGRASIEASAGFPEDFAGELAVQCGPRLVEEGGLVGVHRDDGHRFARTAACVRDAGRTLDLVLTWNLHDPLRGPGLQWFARRLAGPSPTGDPSGCERALNLDGGPSTGFSIAGAPGHPALGPTPWLLTAHAL